MNLGKSHFRTMATLDKPTPIQDIRDQLSPVQEQRSEVGESKLIGNEFY